jgi:hypothetical protein
MATKVENLDPSKPQFGGIYDAKSQFWISRIENQPTIFVDLSEHASKFSDLHLLVAADRYGMGLPSNPKLTDVLDIHKYKYQRFRRLQSEFIDEKNMDTVIATSGPRKHLYRFVKEPVTPNMREKDPIVRAYSEAQLDSEIEHTITTLSPAPANLEKPEKPRLTAFERIAEFDESLPIPLADVPSLNLDALSEVTNSVDLFYALNMGGGALTNF